MFLVLAGSAAEVQTRLHQSFPVQSARAGAKEMGEEGAGGFSRPTVRCCSQAEEAEESPQCPACPCQWYCASSHPHLSHQLYCQLSHCSCSGCLPRPVTHTDTEQRARGIVSNHNVLFFKAYTDIFKTKPLIMVIFCSIIQYIHNYVFRQSRPLQTNSTLLLRTGINL